MNDLDSRLRDALDAAARTIPDHASGPGLLTAEVRRGVRPRTWAVAALAAAAVGAAIAVPLAIARDQVQTTAPTDCAAPPAVENPLQYPKLEEPSKQFTWINTLPYGAAPKVPFTMTGTGGGNYLQDGDLRVPLPAGKNFYSWGRVTCGWVGGLTGGGGSGVKIGVLETSGRFREFGELTGDGMALSPQKDRIAFVRPDDGGKARLVVIETATGREVASTPTSPETEVVGWNSHGIFFMEAREESRTRLWTLDSAPAPVPTGNRRLTVFNTTDRMVLQPTNHQQGQTVCTEVVTFDTGRLNTVMKRCGTSAGESTLSPNGDVLVTQDRKTGGPIGLLVPANTPTKLTGAELVLPHHEALWEDARHILSSPGLGTDRQVTLRCDVIDGDCEKISYGPQKPLLHLGIG